MKTVGRLIVCDIVVIYITEILFSSITGRINQINNFPEIYKWKTLFISDEILEFALYPKFMWTLYTVYTAPVSIARKITEIYQNIRENYL